MATTPEEREETLIAAIGAELRAMEITPRKILCGREHRVTRPGGDLLTRSAMIADLTPPESVRIQQRGIGPDRILGCGLFLPHKGIAAVGGRDGE